MPKGLGEQASVIVNNYIKRPEGILYEQDANGNPCHMPGLTPSFSYVVAGGVAAGNGVAVTVTPPNVRPDMVGEVLILDRGSPDKQEAVVVASVSGNNQVTFASVQFSHAANVKADVGCVITEERTVPDKRSIVRYTRFPCVSILSLMGRYAYGRRSAQAYGSLQEANLLASVQSFGGPPQWIPILVSQTSWSDATGEIWIPAGMLLAYYSDIKLKYVAGYVDAPDPIVRATAMVAANINAGSALGGGAIKLLQAGGSRIERFSASFLDNDIRAALEPFKARLFY